MRKFAIAAMLWACAASIAAEPQIPNLNVPEKELGDARKYVVFHKAGVSAEQAEADLTFCYAFLPHGASRVAPDFVAWGEEAATPKMSYGGGNYGLVGMGIAAIIDGPLERSIRQSRLYRCMVPRGYARYRTSEAIWKSLNDDADTPAQIRIQAMIAAGPTPPTPSIEP
jgi:hypothetical protein